MSLPPLSTTLLTERCLLRVAHARDAASLYEATGHAEFTRWMSWNRPASAGVVASRFRKQRRMWAAGEAYCFTVEEQQTQRVIGGVDLKADPFEPAPDTLNMGYWTHPEHQGQGYASEFVPAVVDWSFEALAITRLVAGVGVDNAPSRRLMDKLGFEVFDQREVCSETKRFPNLRYSLSKRLRRGRDSNPR